MLNFLIQEGAEETAQAIDAETTEKTLSVLELVMNGGLGAQIIIGVLFILLFVAVYIYFERLFALKQLQKLTVIL